MSISRRELLKRSGALVAGTWASSWLRHPLVRAALAENLADRFFIVLYLEGGNDGLNTVVPYENGSSGKLREAYAAARLGGPGGLRIAAAELADMLIPPD